MTTSKRLYSNNAKTTLASAIGTSDTTIQVSDGSRFPNPAAGQYFLATLEAAGIFEIVIVGGRSGNTFTNVIRAQDGFVASSFPAGARIDNRTTKGTLESFARLQDRLAELASVDSLSSPLNSDSNSYILHSNDDGGNPIIAFRDSDTSWRYAGHKTIVSNGSATSGTTTTVNATNINISAVVSGKYIIQFATGANIGLSRLITASSIGSVTWVTPLPTAPVAGDQFLIYQSDVSVFTSLLAGSDDGLIYAILLN